MANEALCHKQYHNLLLLLLVVLLLLLLLLFLPAIYHCLLTLSSGVSHISEDLYFVSMKIYTACSNSSEMSDFVMLFCEYLLYVSLFMGRYLAS